MSVNGSEEDGVDNRVEAPTWASDGGSDSAAEDNQAADDAASPSSNSNSAQDPAKADAATPKSALDQESSAQPSKSASTSDSDPARWQDSVGQNQAAASPPAAPATQAGPVLAAKPSPPTPAPSAARSAADTTRGLAARVTSPFSGLTKPKPKPKSSGQVKRPAGNGQPPRPQGVRPQARLTPGQQAGPQSRRAQLRLDRIEPWSVMKFSFLLSLVGWVILFVAVSILYFALSKLGVFTSIEHTVGLVTANKTNPAGSNAASWFRASRVLGYTMLVGAVNVILMTALATIGAVLYNLVTMLAGGVEVTLKESD